MSKKINKKAGINELSKLHGVFANYLTEELESGEELSSGTLAAINSFLKNNNITADITESEPLQNLQSKISKLMLDEED